jgi:predicted PurR-regulated permease PerM
MSTAQLQRLAVIGVCASAAVFLAACAWLLVGFLAPVLGLFLGGWLLACLQEPLVAWVMCRTRAGRTTAVAVTVLSVLVALAIVGFLVAPTLGHKVSTSVIQLPGQVDGAAQQVAVEQRMLNAWLAEQGVDLQVDLTSAARLDTTVVQQTIGTSANPMAVVGGALGVVGSLGTMLLLSLFFLLGGPQLADQVIRTFSGRAASDVRFVLTTVHDVFEGFARSQLLQAAMYAAGVWACLSVAHVAIAPLVAALAGITLIVPLVGAALAIAVPVVATLLWNPGSTLPVVVVVVVLEQLILNVVGPRLMSRQLGLPPLLVLFGILAGAQVAGFWGAVLGIPTLATLLTCVEHFRPRWST